MDQPRTRIATDYVMTLHSPLEPPQQAGGDLQIYNVRPGGWLRGPAIRGEVIPPSGDWLRTMPDGVRKLDVRLSIRTDDGALVFMSFVGRTVSNADALRRLDAGETLGPDQLHFMIAPTFETASDKYAWLNGLVTVGKLVSLNRSHDRHVAYDIFAVR